MPVVTSVNGGQGRVVFGGDGRPAHVLGLGPIHLRMEIVGVLFDDAPVYLATVVEAGGDMQTLFEVDDIGTMVLDPMPQVWEGLAPVP